MASFAGVIAYGVIGICCLIAICTCSESRKGAPHSMFPGVDGFHWTVGHILFLSIFFAVVVVILATVLCSMLRTARVLRTHPAAELCWKSDFAELPTSERRCRHELAGRVASRICDMAFDCRECRNYEKFASLPASYPVNDLGLIYPPERYYHRGHTWVEPTEDGNLTVGLDDLAVHLIGNPDWWRCHPSARKLTLTRSPGA